MPVSPYLTVPASFEGIKISVPKARRGPERLDDLCEALKGRFTTFEPVRVKWVGTKLEGSPGDEIRLVEVQKRGRELHVHAIMAHEDIPDDILRAVVFLGLVLAQGVSAQRKALDARGTPRVRIPDPLGEPKLSAWIDDSMGVEPARDWLGDFVTRFWEWTATL